MAVDVKRYDAADYLTDRETIYQYLVHEMENDEPLYMARALGSVARARGGVTQLAAETGVSAESLTRAIEGDIDREMLLTVIAAFRDGSSTRVA